MGYPVVDLDTSTRLLFRWGWLLATGANAAICGVVVLLFVLGVGVRLPGVRGDIRRVGAQGIRPAGMLPGAGRDGEGRGAGPGGSPGRRLP